MNHNFYEDLSSFQKSIKLSIKMGVDLFLSEREPSNISHIIFRFWGVGKNVIFIEKIRCRCAKYRNFCMELQSGVEILRKKVGM